MRIEHNGTYAVVASNAGAPTHPFWYSNIVANPLVELQDDAVKQGAILQSKVERRFQNGPNPPELDLQVGLHFLSLFELGSQRGTRLNFR